MKLTNLLMCRWEAREGGSFHDQRKMEKVEEKSRVDGRGRSRLCPVGEGRGKREGKEGGKWEGGIATYARDNCMRARQGVRAAQAWSGMIVGKRKKTTYLMCVCFAHKMSHLDLYYN